MQVEPHNSEKVTQSVPGGTAMILVIVGATGTINDFPPQIISLASQYKMGSIQVWPVSLQWGNPLNVLDWPIS